MDGADRLKDDLLARIAAAGLAELEEIRVGALGRSGSVTALVKSIGGLPAGERRAAGRKLNLIKDALAEAVESRRSALEAEAIEARLAAARADVTLPARPERQGLVHAISRTIDEMVAIFCEMGFAVADGPHIETDFNNFTALNIPPEHPARQDHDTFYLAPGDDGSRRVLRTHTSPVQIRTMLAQEPPIRIVVPGRTFRADHDATHSPMFHQIEGLAIGTDIHMGHLKGCLIEFCRAFFAVDDLPVRFRPSYFPFTEPSAEVDIGCTREGGGLAIGRGSGAADWLEILGCGMVNPRVLGNCGIDPSRWQGFAFGLGIERAAMLKHGIPDLRTFFESDIRWLERHGFPAFDSPGVATGFGGGAA